MKYTVVRVILLISLVIFPIGATTDSEEADVVVHVWGAINNQVLDVYEIYIDEDTNLIAEIIAYDNCTSILSSRNDYKDVCARRGSTLLVGESDLTLEYRLEYRRLAGRVTFRVSKEEVTVKMHFARLQDEIQIAFNSAGFTAHRSDMLSSTLRTSHRSFELDKGMVTVEFLYGQSGRVNRIETRTADGNLTADVTNATDNHYIIEMPPYGDPGEFSHRIEVWTDKPSRGTLRSAAINSYLLPAGTFDFIFPFFAPTPQEVFEQAAAGE